MKEQSSHTATTHSAYSTRRAYAHLVKRLLSEKQRWLLWLPVMIALGIYIYYSLRVEPSPAFGMAAILITTISLIILRRYRIYTPVSALCLILLCISLGFGAAQWERWRIDTPLLTKASPIITLQGVLTEIIDTDAGMKIILSHVKASEESSRHAQLPHQIRLSLKRPDKNLRIGQTLELRAGLFPLPRPALPGGFDFSRHFYFQGIGAVGFAVPPIHILQQSHLPTYRLMLEDARLSIAREIRHIIDDRLTGPVAAALITGDRAAIAPEVKEAMRGAGLAHMLAISGLHLGLVTAILYLACRYLLLLIPGWAVRYPIKKWAALLALAGSFGYLALAGFPVSAQRAYFMVALLLGAIILDRQVMPMRSVALAAIFILLAAPSFLLSPSFQLSFAATIAIIAVFETIPRPDHRRPWLRESLLYKPLLYFGGIMITSLAASAATSPFIIFHFNQFTLWDVLGNLGASAILSLWVMPCAVVSLILLPLGLAHFPLWLMDVGIEGILSIAFWVSNLPHALHYVPSLSEAAMALIILGGCWLLFWQTSWRWWGALPIATGLISLFFAVQPDIIIAENAEQIAVKATPESNHFSIIKGSNRNFNARMWQESLGISEWKSADHVSDLRCDNLGCLFQRRNHTLSIAKSPSALAEDCYRADVIISDFYHDCDAASITVERNRAPVSLYIEDNSIDVRYTHSFADRIIEKNKSASRKSR